MFSQISTICAAQKACGIAQSNFQSRADKLEREYRKYSPDYFMKENKPYWRNGKNDKIAYFLHGFIGSPYEMEPIARILMADGYTIVNDLIPGHGINGSISNHYDAADWRQHVEKSIGDLKNCSSEINLIGFSTGALLIHDYLTTHPEFSPQSVVLYSPFYIAHLTFISWIKDIARWITPTVPVAPLYKISRHQDIEVAVKDNQHYMQQIPLDTTTVIQKLGNEVFLRNQINSEVPTLLFVSANDQVLNYEVTLKKVSQDFKNLSVVLFSKKQKIPHHLMVNSVSPVARQVQKQGAEFIIQHSMTYKKSK